MFKGCCFGGQRLANDSPEFSDRRKIKSKDEDGGGREATGTEEDTGDGEDNSTHANSEVVEGLKGIPCAETAERPKEEENVAKVDVIPGNSSLDQLPKDKGASDGTYNQMTGWCYVKGAREIQIFKSRCGWFVCGKARIGF